MCVHKSIGAVEAQLIYARVSLLRTCQGGRVDAELCERGSYCAHQCVRGRVRGEAGDKV